ncbi:MAG: radical SAM protein [Candidatus Lernaella stagnicola]|nr:radical SAM protein [Candidatus Lernaella stagnicola]
MRVALIHPALPAKSAFERLGRSDLPPLGLLYLAAVLENEGHAVRVFDFNLASQRHRGETDIVGWSPDLVGISTLAATYEDTVAVAARLRQRLGEATKFVAGGADATIQTARYLDTGLFDAVFLGEAEETIVDFCHALPRVDTAAGVATPASPDVERSPKVQPDAVPFPARHLLPLQEYRGGPAYKRQRRSTSIFTHRGCPYSCEFCEKSVHDGPVRYRSAASIYEEISGIRREHDIHDIRFIDDVLMINRPVLEGFAELIRANGEPLDWMCTGRVDLMDEGLLRIMKAAGCYRVEIGIESGDDETLGQVNKKLTTAQALEAIATARRVGLEIVANYLLGLPGESRAAMGRTVDFAEKIDADYSIFFLFVPFRGAAITQRCGLEFDPAYPGYRKPSPAYQVSTEEVEKLIDRAYGRLYYRWRYILRRLRSIRSPWIVWDLAYMATSHLWRRLLSRPSGTATYRTGG